jgi:transketolase
MKLAPHINPKLFDADAEREANRVGYGKGLLKAGEQDPRIVALCADLTESTQTHLFAEKFPERFIEMGIEEQSMASVASGMSAMGKIPFIASYAMFSPGRSWEQVRTTIAYNDANVKIIGAHSGVSVGPDGATHQAIEDMAIMRVIPRMTVIAPADAIEAEKAVLAAAAHHGPVYIRIAREKTLIVTTADTPFAIGKADIYMEKGDHPKSVGLIGTGTALAEAMAAGKALNEEGIGASVMNIATIKPLDEDAVLKFAESHDILAVVEEHQAAGGLGSAVSEFLSEVRPTKVLRIGVRDQFGQSGTQDELLAHYGLNAASVVARIKKELGA